MMDHLRQMHNNLVLQSGLDIPHISGTSSVVAEHLGEDVIPAKKEPSISTTRKKSGNDAPPRSAGSSILITKAGSNRSTSKRERGARMGRLSP
jgi:hypothetical protein